MPNPKMIKIFAFYAYFEYCFVVKVHFIFLRFQASKPHNDPERILHRKYVEVCSLVRRLDERNQQLAARIEDMVIMYIIIFQVIITLSAVVS